MEAVANRQNAKKDGDGEGSDSSTGFKFSSMFGSSYYDGGFDDKMTRREAALILGIRESSPRDRVRAAHRKVLRANHPDMGGSTYMASKINEAKDHLLGQSKD